MNKYLYFIVLVFFGFGNVSLADTGTLKISEVMYDFPGTDDGHEYIKIENNGVDPVDITGYKFIDGGSATLHAINLPPKNGSTGSPVIAPSSFLILADNAATYMADNPSFSGSVLDSTFSLNNDGATVQLLDKDDNIVTFMTYPIEVPPPPPDDEETPTESLNIFINEIMYDVSGTDDGREWVEVYNIGTGDVDLTGLKLFENETNHGITSIGVPTVPAGGFAVIAADAAQFSVDWPEFQGLIFDSAFSLSNTGEDIALKDADDNIIDQISYTSDMGGAGDERSLQKNGDNFITALPTPGEVNKSSAEPPAEEDDSNDDSSGGGSSGGGGSGSSSSSSSTNITPKVIIPKIPKISFKINSPDYAVAGSSFELGANGEAGRYVWNFGNGEVTETKDNNPFNYIYQFPGSYMITFNYFKDEKSKPIKVSAKIKVDENPINISKILSDGSVEIHNKATHQIDFSGWILQAGDKRFVIPKETVLLSGGKIVLAARITQFYPNEKDIRLLYPSGETAFSFGKVTETKEVKPIKTEKVAFTESSYVNKAAPIAASVMNISKPVDIPASSEIKGVDLSASVVNSLPDGTRPLFPWALGLGGIIVLSSFLSFVIFSGKAVTSSGFKIVD